MTSRFVFSATCSYKTPRSYQADFDPDEYLDAYYYTTENVKEQSDLYPFLLDSLHDIFTTGSNDVVPSCGLYFWGAT